MFAFLCGSFATKFEDLGNNNKVEMIGNVE